MKPMKRGVLASAEHDESAEAPEQESLEPASMQAAEGNAEPESHESGAMEAQETGQDGDEPSMQDPAYRKARELMLSKLYEHGAAQGIAQALAQAPNIVTGIVDQSMALGQVMEDTTQGAVPDELVLGFVLDITQEVVDIAQASGLRVAPGQMAQAVQGVLAKTIEAFGGDASAVQQEMSGLDPNEVGQAAMQGGGHG